MFLGVPKHAFIDLSIQSAHHMFWCHQPLALPSVDLVLAEYIVRCCHDDRTTSGVLTSVRGSLSTMPGIEKDKAFVIPQFTPKDYSSFFLAGMVIGIL